MSKFKQREMTLDEMASCDDCYETLVEQSHTIQALTRQVEMLQVALADSSDRDWRDAMDKWFDENHGQLEFQYV